MVAAAVAVLGAGCGSSAGGGAADVAGGNDGGGVIDVADDAGGDAGGDAVTADAADGASVDVGLDADAVIDAGADVGTDAADDIGAFDGGAADTVSDATADADTAADAAADAMADTAADTAADGGGKDVILDAGTVGGCDDETPCIPGFANCAPAGTFPGCGICKNEEGCTSDTECSGTKNGICIYKASDCTCSGEKLCHEGCAADADCGTGEVCAADHHCKPAPCQKGSDCPAYFGCFASTKTCGRKNCNKSAECGDGGWCIGGKCYDKPGVCQVPPP